MVIYNARIFPVTSDPIPGGWIEITNGVITGIQAGSYNGKISTEDINANGQCLVPGFVDAHTHIGVIENALGFEGDDSNEISDPFAPHLRTIDAVNPFDTCFEEARTRGITTIVAAPGSANPVAGQIIAMKTLGRRVDDMLIGEIGMKFSLGENPKCVYNERNETPVTRMAVAAIIREGLFKAKKYMNDLEAYKNDPENNQPPDTDIKSESLIPVIKKEKKAHFHCHRADDIFTALRIGREFDLDIVIVHATEAYTVADIIGKDIGIITGPLISDRCKPELSRLSIKNPSVLFENGLNIAISTDHPVVPVQYLPLSALLAVKGGLPYDEAVKAVTINPARITGIDKKVGSIEIGKDADLQLYDEYTCMLDILTEPNFVMINGKALRAASGGHGSVLESR